MSTKKKSPEPSYAELSAELEKILDEIESRAPFDPGEAVVDQFSDPRLPAPDLARGEAAVDEIAHHSVGGAVLQDQHALACRLPGGEPHSPEKARDREDRDPRTALS